MKRARTVLNVGSALLVTGILHMLAWMRWPTALVADADAAAGVGPVTALVPLDWGAAYSLLAAAWYVPTATRLTRRARELLAEAPERTGEKTIDQRLAEHGLATTPLRQLPQVAVILGPLLAGPVGAALAQLGSALG